MLESNINDGGKPTGEGFTFYVTHTKKDFIMLPHLYFDLEGSPLWLDAMNVLICYVL